MVLDYATLREVRATGETIEHPNPYDKPGATYHLLDDLLRAVEEGRAPETSAADNLYSMRILEAAYRSLAVGQPVRVADIG